MAAALPCSDNATYSFLGARGDSQPVTWHCADWTGYLCSPGGFGVELAADITELLEACPASCADGRCHNASVPARLLPLSGARFDVVREGEECGSDNLARGLFGSSSATGGLQECANECFVSEGCEFFIYGVGSQAGLCFQETTSDVGCAEGWEAGDYNFYKLVPPLPPSPLPTPGVVSANALDQAEIHQTFDLFDTDSSGTINVGEFHAMLRQMGYDLDQQQVQAVLAQKDLDSSGTLNFVEFEQMVAAADSSGAGSYGGDSYGVDGGGDGGNSYGGDSYSVDGVLPVAAPSEEELHSFFDQFDTNGDASWSGFEPSPKL